MGAERKTMVMSEEEKEITAYHEAGHALVAAFLPDADPVHKITIIPRGRALGLTMQLPTEDKHTYKKRYVEAQIAILMGGRVAEELTQRDVTTGAGNDIERATDLARQMVCEWGMSELGPLSFGDNKEPVFLGRDFSQRPDYSDHTAVKIDEEVTRIVREGHQRATAILTEHRDLLERLARGLLERESVDGAYVYDLIEHKTGEDLRPNRKPTLLPRPAAAAGRVKPREEERAPAGGGIAPEPATARNRETEPDLERSTRAAGLSRSATADDADGNAERAEPGELHGSKSSR
jgi:cell division protease FtsH